MNQEIGEIEEMRLNGKKAIGTVIKKENNIIIFEKWVYKISLNDKTEYIKNIFQIVQDLKNGKDRNEVLNNINIVINGYINA